MTFSTAIQSAKTVSNLTGDEKELNTDQGVEIQYNRYYRHVYNLLFPLKQSNSYLPLSQPDELLVLRELINLYLKDPQKSTPGDQVMAIKLSGILKEYSAETLNSKTGKETFNNLVARCNQLINKFDFKKCEQMKWLFASYYSFFPDKLPQKFAMQPQFFALINPTAWAHEIYHFVPNIMQYNDEDILYRFWRANHQLLNLHVITSFNDPFNAVINFQPSHFLQLSLHYRLKLIEQIMREHLIAKPSYQLKNWIVFLVTVKFFEYIPSLQRKEIIDAYIQQFNALLSKSNDKYANHLRILSLDAINKIYPYANQVQQDILNKLNENLVGSVYQLLSNQNVHGAITNEISTEISREAENPILFILSRTVKNINNLSIENQKFLISQLLAYFDKVIVVMQDIRRNVDIIIVEVITNLKSDELKQFILDHLLKQYPAAKSDSQKISWIHEIFKNSIHSFSEEHQRTLLDFFLDNVNSQYHNILFIDIIKNVTSNNAVYITSALIDPASNYELCPILVDQQISDIKFQKNTIYIREIDGRIAYSLITPAGEQIKDHIVDSLFAPKPLTIVNVNTLKLALLDVTRKLGHTYSQQLSVDQKESISLIVSAVCHILPQDLQARTIAYCLPIVANALQQRNLDVWKLNKFCKGLLNLSVVASEAVRDQLIDITITVLNSIRNKSLDKFYFTRLIIQLYQCGTLEQKDKLYLLIKPFYLHHLDRNHPNNFGSLLLYKFFDTLHSVFSALDDNHRTQIIAAMEVGYSRIRDGREWVFNAMLLIHYLLSDQLPSSVQSVLNSSKEKFFSDSHLHTKVVNLAESIQPQKLISFLEKVFQLLIPALQSEQSPETMTAYINALPEFIKRLHPDEQIGLLRKLEAIFMINQGGNAYSNARVKIKPIFNAIYNERQGAKTKLQQQAIFFAAVAETLNANIEILDVNDIIMSYAGAPSKNLGVNKVNVESSNDETALTPDAKLQSVVVGIKRKTPYEEKDVKALPSIVPKQKITPNMDYFNTFITLNFAGKQQLAAELKDGILNPMIQYGAQQLLAGLNIDNVYSFVIGPDYAPRSGMFKPGQGWNPSDQLKKYLADVKFQNAKYTFCSFAVLTGNHSVAVLFDKEHKKIYCIDSLGVKGLGEQDAVAKLTAAIHAVPQLKDFTIETPKKMEFPQQMDVNDPNCGIYTIRNVIGLILMLENKEVNMPKFKGETILPSINLITGAGLEPIQNNELIDVWRVVIKYAYEDLLEQTRSHKMFIY